MYHLLFVNDGSEDNTLKILIPLSKKFNNVSILNLEENLGKAEATRRGMLHLLPSVTNDGLLGFWDADLSTPLEESVRFKELFRDSSVHSVLGSRVMILGHVIEKNTLRHLLGRIFATAASCLLKMPVYDTQCGAKIFRKDVANKIFQQKFISPWFFDIELLFRMKENKLDNIYELPLKKWIHHSDSKMNIIDILKVPLELLKIWQHYR